MKALRVTIDGNARTTADISRGTVGFVLSAGHHPGGEERPTYLSLAGLDDHNRLRWLDIHGLKTGTCIKLELVDSDDVDEPQRLPVDPERVDRNDRDCLLYTSPSPRDQRGSRMPSSA